MLAASGWNAGGTWVEPEEAGGPGPPIWNSCPVDALGALGAVGLMHGEFWPKQRSMYNVKEIACAAHTYGKTIVDAESLVDRNSKAPQRGWPPRSTGWTGRPGGVARIQGRFVGGIRQGEGWRSCFSGSRGDGVRT